MKSAFSIYFIKQIGFWLCKTCNKIQELENRRDLHTPALGPFNYHIKGKCKCLYQLLINLMLPISIRQMFEVLKQRQETKYTETYSEPYETYKTECFAKKVFNYLCKLFSKCIHCVKSTHIRSYSGPYFSAFGWIKRDTPYLSLFSPNAGKWGSERLRIRTLLMQWYNWDKFSEIPNFPR